MAVTERGRPPTSSVAGRAGSQGQRVDPSELRALPLRAHELLRGVPLHDVWRFRLGGEPGVTVRDVIELFVRGDTLRTGRLVRLLFALRTLLGRVFGWDREDPAAPLRSYLRRLTPEDHARSVDQPGAKRGPWTSLYTFDREALGEIINRTVHAFVLFALEPAVGGYTLYWGIYVKPVNRFTAWYMALIDPFRRHLIYPAIIRCFETIWRESKESRAGV